MKDWLMQNVRTPERAMRTFKLIHINDAAIRRFRSYCVISTCNRILGSLCYVQLLFILRTKRSWISTLHWSISCGIFDQFSLQIIYSIPIMTHLKPKISFMMGQHRDSCNTILIDMHLRYSFERENLIILFRIYLMSFSLNVKDFFQTIFQSSIKRIVCITLKRKDG